MNRLSSISYWLYAILLSVCLAACSSDDVMPGDHPGVNDGCSIKLRLSFSTGTRANPTGGEEGDGRENGVWHENDIDRVAIFIFRSPEGFDAPASTGFLYKGYFVKGDRRCQWTPTADGVDIQFSADGYALPTDGDRVIVVANTATDITTYISTLGSLRDYQGYSSWTDGASLRENTGFVMSSAYNNGADGLIVTSHKGSETDPYITAMNIQRTAARIDFMYNATDNGDGSTGEFLYDVRTVPGDNTSPLLGRAHLSNLIPVNLMQQSSYLIRRVTESASVTAPVRYGALETTDGSGVPTNYVIEPHTLLKQNTVDGDILDRWYGTTRARTVYATPGDYLSTTGIAGYLPTATARTEMGYFTHHVTLAYTNENTQSKEQQKPDFLTGLLVRAVYEPATVYTDGAATSVDTEHNYSAGHTFWRYSPTRTEMAEKDCKYFSNSAAATAYKAAHPEDMAEVEMFQDGVCYYNIWLRHANTDGNPHLTFPMEYGIVRNNIYRVGIETVTGPGTAIPDLQAPDHIYLRIFVRKWNLREQPVIRL